MDYGILGPLQVRDRDRELSLGSPRLRALLGLLLLHRNEPVSSERLIDELWDGAPPATANKALQNGVSQLRRVLADDVLRTVPRGYELRVGENELDADRFERALDAARDDSDPESAAATLRAALELWRGPALPELADVIAAQPELARLEDRRAAAFEDRVEADLERGRHAELVGELEAEVARHPLRERLRAQLMLALYRSGRQADALVAYQDARRTLVDDLGLEPGPELRARHEAILRQDPALDPPAAPARTWSPAERRAPLALLLGGAALLAVVVAAGVLLLTRDDERPAGLGAVPGNSLVALDVRTGRVTATVPAGSTPASVAAGQSDIWAINADDGTLTRAGRETSATRTFAVPASPTGLAAGPSGLWISTGVPAERVLRLEPATGAVIRPIRLPPSNDSDDIVSEPIAVGRDAVWAVGPGFTLLKIDPEGARPPSAVRGIKAFGVVAEGAGAWAIAPGRDSDLLVRVSPRGRVNARVPIKSTGLDGLASGADAVWVTAPQDGLLWRVTPDMARPIDVGAGARGVAVAGGAVWVANAARGTVTKVDPRTNRVVSVTHIGNAPRGLAAAADRLWVTVAAAGGVPARDAGRAASGGVRSSTCSEVISDTENPQRVIVSDLPLRRAGIGTLPDAIGFVLRRHGFRAGSIRLGYQSCDDSTAQSGDWDGPKCRANAGLYAKTPRVIGIVGPLNSDCTLEQLAVTNRAPGGPLATISPTNSLLELTKPVPGARPGRLAELYPTGVRHFARLYAANDAQGAALARYAHERGFRRVTIVDGGQAYGRALSWHARRTARELGLDVVGPRRLNVLGGAAHVRSNVRRLVAARPDALLYAGVAWGDAYPFVRQARARLGADFPVLASDGWSRGAEVFAELGRAAENIAVFAPGLPVQRLGPAGRRFVREFGASQPGGKVSTEAVYAAQATEILLDAIARSDGTRPSVTRALLATDIRRRTDRRRPLRPGRRRRPTTLHRLRLVDSPMESSLLPDGSNIIAVVAA